MNDSTPSRPGPTVFVLFGATGDLAARMVLPAFYRLAQEDLLPEHWRLVGNGRGDVSHEDFAGHVEEVLREHGPQGDKGLDDELWKTFRSRLRFAGGGFDTDDPGSLLAVISEARSDLDDPLLVHYLAIPPKAFLETTRALGEHGLAKGSRVVFEKPYGTSMESFHELDQVVHEVLSEDQVFRIDHFLGKEATQDLHVARFANALLRSTWDREQVAAVQVDVPETLGIEDRAEFYDETGAFLDMIVTHLFQLAAEVAMEPPASLEAKDLQAAREQVIAGFRALDPGEVVLGQFEGYRETKGVADDSRTDTYVAARLWVDTDRWRDVPFLLRTGKRLAESHQQVTLIYRDQVDGPVDGVPAQGNALVFDLAGDGAMRVRLVVKRPGAELAVESVRTDLPLSSVPAADPLPAYVRLLHDVLVGDRSLFTRPDGLQHVWEVAQPLLDARPDPVRYRAGSWGPTEADRLAEPGGWLLGG